MHKTIVILGGGFGAVSLAKSLDPELNRIVLVSPRDHFVFTPLLASAAVGTVEPESITEPLWSILPKVELEYAWAQELDLENKRVLCSCVDTDQTLLVDFDILIVAVGAKPAGGAIPGVGEHALQLREAADARRIRNLLIRNIQQASEQALDLSERAVKMQFTVVGGGPTGVEFAAELNDLLQDDVAREFPEMAASFGEKYPPFNPQIRVIESKDRVLGQYRKLLSAYTQKHFQRSGISVLANSRVKEVTSEGVLLDNGDFLGGELVVWSTGNEPREFVATGPFPLHETSRILVDSFLRVEGLEDVYAIGDCAVDRAGSWPATAQIAQQQGEYLAVQINRMSASQEVEEFQFRNFGMLAYLGRNKALADFPLFPWTGFTAWLFWRSVYLAKQVSVRNKFAVASDWARVKFFGRSFKQR